MATQKATFAAGCFWGVQQAFDEAKGVIGTTVGYTGGTKQNPAYEQVCTGKTGHAEAIEIVFDPAIISYKALVDLFFSIHNPAQKDRQGPDVGTQYRSAIFYHDDEQQAIAEQTKRRLEQTGKRIVTQIVPAAAFYPAEEYHQRYLAKRGGGTCHW